MAWPALTSFGDAASRKVLLRLVCLLLFSLGLAGANSPPRDERIAVVLHLDGAIGPASADFFKRSLAKADTQDAAIVILRIDTPGGLDTSMRDMIREIVASPVPVVTFVAPGGARAASAGTYLLYASHVAAMAPGTNVGAATPVQIGGLPGSPSQEPTKPGAGDAADGKPGDQSDNGVSAKPARSASEAKATNDAVAYIRALANLRERNADWAERAVRQSESLEAQQALALGVIDTMALDVPQLLDQIDGRRTNVGGSVLTLQTRDLAIKHVRPDWRHRLLAAITNPNVALILMMVGVYGLIFEFMNPGAIYPGTIGLISLITGLYALAVLPVNYAGVALILVGAALIVAEAFTPSFGILGIGGGAAFVLGAMMFIDTDLPQFEVSLPLAVGVAAASLGFTLLVLRMALTSRRRRVVSGREAMIGSLGVVQDWSDGAGHVFVHSERWRAVSDTPLRPGDRVRTVAINELTLTVARGPSADSA